MPARKLGIAVVVSFGLSLTLRAQIVGDMTPNVIRTAIAMGTKAKDLGWYRIQEKAKFSWPPVIAFYTTPFLRVALAANDAKNHYQPFTEANVTPEMIAPRIIVFAPSHPAEGAEIANVETIVLLPHNSRDAGKAIHPTEMKDASQEYQNLMGFRGEGRGIVAIFPIEEWRESADVHVIFDRGIPGSMGPNAVGGCTDCKARLYLKSIY